jgi:MFS transporter, FHS family, L-fucose permease
MIVSNLPSASHGDQPKGASLIPQDFLSPFLLVTALFALWGIVNNLNDILIRQFMKSFAISRLQAGLVQSAFYMGYFLLAMPAALLMRRWGYKVGFMVGLTLFAIGSFLFWPAAEAESYSFFLFSLFVIAAGASCLETASNPFIAQLGASATSELRLNFSQAFNPLGSIVGVLIGTIFIFSGIELKPSQISAMRADHSYEAYLRSETLRIVRPYMLLGVVALIWAFLIFRTRFPPIQGETEVETGAKGRVRDLFQFPHFLFAVLAQFMYVGTQVATWSYFIQYVQAYGHEPEKIAGYFLTGTLAAFAVGRFSAAYLMRYLDPRKLMGAYSLINIALLLTAVLKPGWLGIWAVFLTSFFMSLMFPTIFATGLRGLSVNTKVGGSLIVMGMIGGAVLTPLMGWISVTTQSIANAYVVPLGGYLFVACYAYVGSKLRPRVSSPAAESGISRDGTIALAFSACLLAGGARATAAPQMPAGPNLQVKMDAKSGQEVLSAKMDGAWQPALSAASSVQVRTGDGMRTTCLIANVALIENSLMLSGDCGTGHSNSEVVGDLKRRGPVVFRRPTDQERAREVGPIG